MAMQFSASEACLIGTAIIPIAELHGVNPSVATGWLTNLNPSPDIDCYMDFPTRRGIATFQIDRSPMKIVVVRAQVQQIPGVGDETWYGRSVYCHAPASDWSLAYLIDWMSGEKSSEISVGEYPYKDIEV